MAASRTAQYVAFYRALETARPSPLFRDPFATAFLSRGLAFAVRASRAPVVRGVLTGYADYRAPGARTSAIGRTCFIDDLVRRRTRDGGASS